jgi:EAL domain-containing protein (putative c-di-GMP-specific phosphodiesterase class I)/3-hydroxyisobutyrate dehydrogenase-like beta-hydroxyacid dehydrogenase
MGSGKYMGTPAIGFVGLGAMGSRVAGRLLESGRLLYGTNRTRSRAEGLIEQGLRWRETPREVTEAAEVVFSMVTDDSALDAITFGADGILAGLSRGKILVDLSTVSPRVSQRLCDHVQETGALMLDAAVSGSIDQAEAGTVGILVGGSDDAFVAVEPLLTELGASVTHVGSNGHGLVLTLAIDISRAVQSLAFSEGLLLAERAGINPQLAANVMSTSSIGSPMLKAHVALLRDQPQQAWFDVDLIAKDIRLARVAADAFAAPVPSAEFADDMLTRATELGYAHCDLAGLHEVLASSTKKAAVPQGTGASGRGPTHVVDARLTEESSDRLELSNDLRTALAGDNLALHYQPIVELATGRLVAVEGLARWQHPKWGAVPAATLVHSAEVTGQAALLDRWAVERVCRDYDELRGAFVGEPRITVNISAGHLAASDFEGTVLSAVADYGVPQGGLVLEITESVLMNDPVMAGALLQRLRDRGVESCIDDFGTGYSSLAYLSRLPVTTLKIDRMFIEHITADADALAIVAAMVDLARTLRLTTVAEGVETVEQAAVLRQLGCTAAQGYLWGAAMPPTQLVNTLRSMPAGRFSVPPGKNAALPERAARATRPVTPAHGLRQLLQLHHDGASLFTISDALNADGYRTPDGTPWDHAAVARAVTEVAYPDLWSAVTRR